MNREILFRGKRDGKWVYGSLHIEYGETDKSGNHSLDYRILGMRGECYYVNPETVGQYTGLTDKNSRKIFEGDILSGHLDDLFPKEESRYEVVWHDYGWHIKNDSGIDTANTEWVMLFFEVIGNIHDNPELLNK